jgi:hypothetical protein
MQVAFNICAESVVVDQRRNTVSVFHIYEEWNTPVVPFVIPRFTVLAVFIRTQDEDPGDVFLSMNLANQELFRGQIKLNFQGRLRLRSITELGGLVIAQPGTFRVVVDHQGRELATWEMPINHIGQVVAQPELPLV